MEDDKTESSAVSDEDFSSEDDEDLTSVYLNDLYNALDRFNEANQDLDDEDVQMSALPEANNQPSELLNPSTSQIGTVENKAGTSQNSKDENELKSKEELFEELMEYATKYAQNDKDCMASLINTMQLLRIPVQDLKKINTNNMLKLFEFARLITEPESISML